MPDIVLPPVVTDVRDCVYFAGHSEEFFKAMDALKPYVLLSVSGDSAAFKLYADKIDLTELRNKLERLHNLGYYSGTALHESEFMGVFTIELEDLRISWTKEEAIGELPC